MLNEGLVLGHRPFYCCAWGIGEGIKRQESSGEGIKFEKKVEVRM